MARMGLKVLAGLLALALFGALFALRSSIAESERLRLQLSRIERVKTAAPVVADPVPAVPAPAPAPGDPALRERVAVLERELAEARTPAAPAPVPIDRAPVLKARILDTALTPGQRLAALRTLRFSAPLERTAEVVESMLLLMEASADAEVRADICRQLDKVTDPRFQAALLFRVQRDPSPKVREEAAESLGPLAGDPAVKLALEQAAAGDADEAVRRQAERSLKSRR